MTIGMYSVDDAFLIGCDKIPDPDCPRIPSSSSEVSINLDTVFESRIFCQIFPAQIPDDLSGNDQSGDGRNKGG